MSQVTIVEHPATQHRLWVAALYSGHTGDEGVYIRWEVEPASGGVQLFNRLRIMRLNDYRHLVNGLRDTGWESRQGDPNDVRRVIVAQLDWLTAWASGWRLIVRTCDAAPATPPDTPWSAALRKIRRAALACADAQPDDHETWSVLRDLVTDLRETLPVR